MEKNVSVYPLQTEIHLNTVHPSTAGVSGSKCIPGGGGGCEGAPSVFSPATPACLIDWSTSSCRNACCCSPHGPVRDDSSGRDNSGLKNGSC